MRKWATPERFTQIQHLFHRCGNRCLLGHLNCPDVTHYIEAVPLAVTYPTVKEVACVDKDGNTLKDESGEVLYTQSYSVAIAKGKNRVYRYRPNTLYEQRMNEIIRDWVRDDAEARAYVLKLQEELLHSFSSEYGSLRGTFNAISRTIYHDNQPMFQVLGIGLNALTMKPYAKVRVANSTLALHIDISEALKGLGKCAKRKAVRYGKPLPATIIGAVSAEASKAVRDYLA